MDFGQAEARSDKAVEGSRQPESHYSVLHYSSSMATDQSNGMATGSYACSVFEKMRNIRACKNPTSRSKPRPIPPTRRIESLHECSYDLKLENGIAQLQGGGPKQPDTVLYLAYGSNLCHETFQGRRGIRPLSQSNVVVPELIMTFDLAGLPYVEPCFANSNYRRPPSPRNRAKHYTPSSQGPDYHKTRWKKGLVGVVYEVTKADYAHIIATEGGGASYQDVLVACYDLPPHDPTVPAHPTSAPFKTHTLYSPVFPPGDHPPSKGGRFSRPDPNYAQPSARYLKLITDGADEHGLPAEYKQYLHQLRPYKITTRRQRLGGWIFGMIWLPFITLAFGLNARFADKKGRAPQWLVALTGALFRGMWISYDGFFLKVFGDGERTLDEDEDGVGVDGWVGGASGWDGGETTNHDVEEKMCDVHQLV